MITFDATTTNNETEIHQIALDLFKAMKDIQASGGQSVISRAHWNNLKIADDAIAKAEPILSPKP